MYTAIVHKPVPTLLTSHQVSNRYHQHVLSYLMGLYQGFGRGCYKPEFYKAYGVTIDTGVLSQLHTAGWLACKHPGILLCRLPSNLRRMGHA